MSQVVGTGYVSTLQGICKIIEIVCSLVGALLVGINFIGALIVLYEVAASVSIIVSTILLLIYVTGVVEKIKFSWNRFQFFFHICWSVYYLIVVGFIFDHSFVQLIIGGVFGLIAILAHIADGIDNYRKQPLF